MGDERRTCGNCGSRPCGNFRDDKHGACERWSVMKMGPKWEAERIIRRLEEQIKELRIHVGVVDSIARRTMERTGHVSDVPSPATSCMGFLEADLKHANDSLERLRDVVQCMTTICELVRDNDLDKLPNVRKLASGLVERAVSHREGVSITDVAREMAGALRPFACSVRGTLQECKACPPDDPKPCVHHIARAALARAREAGIEVPE